MKKIIIIALCVLSFSCVNNDYSNIQSLELKIVELQTEIIKLKQNDLNNSKLINELSNQNNKMSKHELDQNENIALVIDILKDVKKVQEQHRELINFYSHDLRYYKQSKNVELEYIYLRLNDLENANK